MNFDSSIKSSLNDFPVATFVLNSSTFHIEEANVAAIHLVRNHSFLGQHLFSAFPELCDQPLHERLHNLNRPESFEQPVSGYFHFEKPGKLIVQFHYRLNNQNQILLTAAKISKELLRKSNLSEARLQNLADSMPQLVWIAKEDGTVIYYNNQLQNFEGAAWNELGSWEWDGIVHPEDRLRTHEAWNKSVRDKTIYEIEHRVKMKDGSFRWHLSRAFPQHDEMDDEIFWYGTATEIQQLKDAEMATRESEARFRIMADATPSIVWALTAEGDHRYLNKFALDYYGVSNLDLSTVDWRRLIHPDDLESTQRALTEAIAQRKVYSHEHRLLRHDGEFRWFLARGAPSYLSNGELFGYVGTGTDIHEWKLAQAALRKNEQMLGNIVKERTLALQRSNDELEQFAHVASHDLKEPLRKIQTFSYKLQNEFSSVLNDRGNTLVGKIISSSDRMFMMINGVLDYASISTLSTGFRSVDLNETMKILQENLELLISEKEASIQFDVLPEVMGTPELIHQLFYNLINNSLKFSKPSEPPRIFIEAKDKIIDNLTFVEVSIMDNGIGFENEYADHIFGTFIRLNSKDKYEGSGLGLAMCKRIVTSLGGTISASSKKGAGSIFTFTLPKNGI